MYFDTHAHLSDKQFDPDRAAALERAQAAGVTRVVEIADSPEDWEKAVALARARPQVRAALGLHPYYADKWSPELGDALRNKARLPEVVAAGEIGLDYAKCPLGPEVQKPALLGMLEAAVSAGLPVVIHCREAFADLLPILEDFYRLIPASGRFRGVLHCFSGGVEEARRACRLGFALGVDGPVTYPKNEPLRQALKSAGLAALVLETDSPYLPPQSSRGKRNEPAAVPEIARALAATFGLPVEQVAEATTRNALELFRMAG